MIEVICFIQYLDRIYAYRAYGGKLRGTLTKESFGTNHGIVLTTNENGHITSMEELYLYDRSHAEVSFRHLDDLRIPKYIREKVLSLDEHIFKTKLDA
jgi:hypothetical protein